MNKKNIIIFIKKFFPKEVPKPLGRWRIENSNNQLNHKIDLSNEDHCGPCGQYAISKINNKIIKYENNNKIIKYEKK
jgi:hypothetical protein